jgi:hypothetical protein
VLENGEKDLFCDGSEMAAQKELEQYSFFAYNVISRPRVIHINKTGLSPGDFLF